jgi:hypothetical protein
MDWWKVTLAWYYHGSYKLITLMLYSSCSYIVVIKLHKLHMYMVSHKVGYIHCKSCNLSNNIHACKNTLNYNEL